MPRSRSPARATRSYTASARFASAETDSATTGSPSATRAATTRCSPAPATRRSAWARTVKARTSATSPTTHACWPNWRPASAPTSRPCLVPAAYSCSSTTSRACNRVPASCASRPAAWPTSVLADAPPRTWMRSTTCTGVPGSPSPTNWSPTSRRMITAAPPVPEARTAAQTALVSWRPAFPGRDVPRKQTPDAGLPGLLPPAAEALALRPLAERMRPRTLDEMVGQRRLLAPGSALRRAVESGRVHSMVLWGPPGCGKTTLALLLAEYADAEYRAISAVLTGLPDVRKVLAEAEHTFAGGRRTVLFVDEVHRFNKVQQDAFLPHIERGTIIFVGATTENPSFELNSALLSRCRVHVMEAVSPDDIGIALRRALDDADRGIGGRGIAIGDEQSRLIATAADGDVRRGLTLLEIAVELVGEGGTITDDTLAQVLADRSRRFDKGGDQFYDQISALHKSVRSSNPDAALY